MTKNKLRERIYVFIDTSIFEGTLEEISKRVLVQKEYIESRYGPLAVGISKYDNYELSLETVYGNYGDSDTTEVAVYGLREESDEEFLKRKEAHEKREEGLRKAAENRKVRLEQKKIEALEKEKELFKKLKEKYDKKGI